MEPLNATPARVVRWDVVPLWGIGWTVGAIALVLAFWLFTERRVVWLSFLLLPTAGASSYGLPTIVGIHRTGSRAPWLQAFIWVLGFTIAAAVLMDACADQHRLAQPGDLNINTTETMRQRQASFDKWGMPPERVASLLFSAVVIISFALASGSVAAIVASEVTTPHRWLAIPLFGLASAGAIIAGLWVGALFASLFPLAAGFAGGCAAGAIIEGARAMLLPNSSRTSCAPTV
jgi:hypothetical protein